MIGFWITWLVNTLALIIVVEVIPGIEAGSFATVVAAALILWLFNAFLRPVVIFFTLPLHVISLGFFTLIINGLMLFLVSKIVEGFYVHNFVSAFWGALLFSIISFLLNLFIDSRGKVRVRFYRSAPSPRRSAKDIIDVEGTSRSPGDDNPPKEIGGS